MSPGRPPSIRGRLAQALLLWSVVWGLGMALAVGLAAQGEVDELLDESLQATAMVLQRALLTSAAGSSDGDPLPATDEGEFAWQMVDADGKVPRRSANAPAEPLHSSAIAGLSRSGGWRVFGLATGPEGRMLYVAHAQSERAEARTEVATGAGLAALAFGLLGAWWLRARVRLELRPLERLTERLAQHDPLEATQALGPAERAELEPVHHAIDDLGRRLARRVAHERAFSAHAAHALRTPLAGMDAQLAVALRESAPPAQARLQRVREASARLQRVVRSLLDLFRIGADVQRQTVRLKALLAHLPVAGIAVVADESACVQADPDLLAAALSNLLDNAQRHGATRVEIGVPSPDRVRVADDGRGIDAARRDELGEALRTQAYEGRTGLGLMLADLVARAHRGRVELPPAASGFVVELVLAPGSPGG